MVASSQSPTPFPFGGYGLVDFGKLNKYLANPVWSSATGLTAHAGGGKTNALKLTATINEIAVVASGADSVLLPPGVPGDVVVIINAGANALQVFGSGTDTIDGVATATGVALTNPASAWFFCYANTPGGAATWQSGKMAQST